jgi:hypothetical protein
LGNAADIGIGYVTGCNEFFHLSEGESKAWGIPKRYLRPAVTSLGEHRGLIFRQCDWNKLREAGRNVYLLALPDINEQKFPQEIRDYLANGRKLGVHSRFKCRVRDPWYSVPHVRVAHALLSYMSGGLPKLVLNSNGFVAPNTLHVVRFAKVTTARNFVAGWHSSLTKLSCEVEGHPLGGGMLKLEPTEAKRLLVALPRRGDRVSLSAQVDRLLREGAVEEARDLVDGQVLRRRFALSGEECLSLREGASYLERWRLHR